VGGASRTPLVRKLLADRFPQKVVKRQGDPQTVVALGAAAAWEDATDPYQPQKPLPPRRQPPATTPGFDRPRPWHSRLAVVPGGSKTSVRLDRYEVDGRPAFGVLARRQFGQSETIGEFIEARERDERQKGWTLTPPTATRIAGAEMGLTQQASGVGLPRTRVYAAVSAFLVAAWSSDTDGTGPGVGAESLRIQLGTAGAADQFGLDLMLAHSHPVEVRETLAARVRLSWSSDYGLVTASTGPLPDGADSPEKLADYFITRLQRANPNARAGAAVPDVFLGSRLCVRHRVTVVRKREDHWWTGLVDGQFVRIVVEGVSARQAEKCRDVIALRQAPA